MSDTDSAAVTDVEDIGAHAWPIVTVAHSQNCFPEPKVSAPFASMMQIEQLFSQTFWHVNSVVLFRQLTIIDDAIKLFTVWRHPLTTALSLSFTGNLRLFMC